MAIIDQGEERRRRRRKNTVLFTVSLVFLLLGVLLHCLNFMFLDELSYFACATTILAGLVYNILQRVVYFSNKKSERVITAFFYVGIACVILKLLSGMIFKNPYFLIHDIISFCLFVGEILLPLSIVITWVKHRKLINLFRLFWGL